MVNLLVSMLFSIFIMSGCLRRSPEAERQQALDQIFAKFRSCAPPEMKTEQKDEDKLKMAIAGVQINPNETAVRIVAYTLDEDINFDLPVYSMSRGRWLINEVGRSYLLDERCREYKLKDRRPLPNHPPLPLDGRIPLNRGQAFEVILSFPRLSDTQIGVLVYGQRIMPFWILNQSQPQSSPQTR